MVVLLAFLSVVGVAGGRDFSGAVDPSQLPTITVVSGDIGAIGAGTVTSSPARISCHSTGTTTSGVCRAGFLAGTEVTLTATPDSNAVFVEWSLVDPEHFCTNVSAL